MKKDLENVLNRYKSILKPCPKCGELMTPLGDSNVDPTNYC